MSFLNSETTRKAYLGKHAQNLILTSSNQAQSVYQERGIIIPVSASSVLQFLCQNEGASLADISRALEIPHQLVAQRIEKLIKLALLKKEPDPSDKRRSGFFLTNHGTDQARRLIVCMVDMAAVYDDLYDEIGCDLAQVLLNAIKALEGNSLASRFSSKFPQKEAG